MVSLLNCFIVAEIIGVTPSDTDDSRKPAIAAKVPPHNRNGRAAAKNSCNPCNSMI